MMKAIEFENEVTLVSHDPFMNISRLFHTAVTFSAFTFVAHAQGTFQNLNFESANIPSSTAIDDFLPASEAIPNWTAYFTSTTTTVPATQVAYDGISGGGGVISIVDSKAYPLDDTQGNYAVILFGGPLIGQTPYSASISQSGTIPSGTESLFMDANSFGISPVVTFSGQAISMVPIQSFPNYTEYGGDISSFAGLTGTLSFTEPPPPATGPGPSALFLDNISFSSTMVTPEPDPVILMGIAGALFAAYRRLLGKRSRS
ncbi:MAG TPA: hypothetical protein VGO67_17140 [Verrucomicrobiae bacterium]|jgi:hypothetical protein